MSDRRDHEARLPRRLHGLTARREGESFVVVSDDGIALCSLNETAAALWELCDGQTTTDEIVTAFRETFSTSGDEVVVSEVIKALDGLEEIGIIEFAPRNE